MVGGYQFLFKLRSFSLVGLVACAVLFLNRKRSHGLFVDQPVEQVEDMGLARCSGLQRQLDGGEHRLLVMLENEGQDFNHLTIAAWRSQQTLLQGAKRLRQFCKRRAVAQGARFALDDREIVPPVVDRCARMIMRTNEDPTMLANHLPLSDDNDALGIDPQADRTIGEGSRHAVAIALEMDEASRRDTFGELDKAVERSVHRHQVAKFLGPDVSDCAGLSAMRRLGPQLPALLLQPVVERLERGKVRHGLPKPMTASCTFFSICPFSQPDAGLQNSASNRKWLTIAEKRVLTWRCFPRPTLSTAVRMLS